MPTPQRAVTPRVPLGQAELMRLAQSSNYEDLLALDDAIPAVNVGLSKEDIESYS
jgi:hypothetical protein